MKITVMKLRGPVNEIQYLRRAQDIPYQECDMLLKSI